MDQNPPDDTYWELRFPQTFSSAHMLSGPEGRWVEAAWDIISLLREDGSFFVKTEDIARHRMLLRGAEAFAARLASALDEARERGVPDAVRFRPVEGHAEGEFLLLDETLKVTTADPLEIARSLCWAGHNIHRLHESLTRDARLQSQWEMRARVRRWESFNQQGLTPYPWELVFNEAVRWFGSREVLEPPKLQVIALRPSVGLEVDSKLGDRSDVIVVEALGLVRYLNHRGWYFGASLALTSPKGAAGGVGFMLHLAPWFKGGAIWRDAGDGDRSRRWLLTIDVYDLLRGTPQALKEAAGRAAPGGFE